MSFSYIVNLIFNKYESTIEIIRKFQNDLTELAKQLKMSKEQLQEYLHGLEIKRFIEIDRENKTITIKEGLHLLK